MITHAITDWACIVVLRLACFFGLFIARIILRRTIVIACIAIIAAGHAQVGERRICALHPAINAHAHRLCCNIVT